MQESCQAVKQVISGRNQQFLPETVKKLQSVVGKKSTDRSPRIEIETAAKIRGTRMTRKKQDEDGSESIISDPVDSGFIRVPRIWFSRCEIEPK